MHSILLLVLLVSCGRNTSGMSTKEQIQSTTFLFRPSSQGEVDVKESWPTNELVFTWDAEHFHQYYKPGANIMIQATVYIPETNERVYSCLLRETNSGTATISISNVEKGKIAQLSHYYVLKPVGTQPNIYLASRVIKSANLF